MHHKTKSTGDAACGWLFRGTRGCLERAADGPIASPACLLPPTHQGIPSLVRAACAEAEVRLAVEAVRVCALHGEQAWQHGEGSHEQTCPTPHRRGVLNSAGRREIPARQECTRKPHVAHVVGRFTHPSSCKFRCRDMEVKRKQQQLRTVLSQEVGTQAAKCALATTNDSLLPAL